MAGCLIVDESSVVRKVAARILFQIGFEVAGAASFEEANALIAANGMPGLLIVAAGGAEGDAPGFVRLARAHPEGRGSVVLGLLVEANLGLMTRLKRGGADGFLHKPFTRGELVAGVQPYLARLGATLPQVAA